MPLPSNVHRRSFYIGPVEPEVPSSRLSQYRTTLSLTRNLAMGEEAQWRQRREMIYIMGRERVRQRIGSVPSLLWFAATAKLTSYSHAFKDSLSLNLSQMSKRKATSNFIFPSLLWLKIPLFPFGSSICLFPASPSTDSTWASLEEAAGKLLDLRTRPHTRSNPFMTPNSGPRHCNTGMAWMLVSIGGHYRHIYRTKSWPA